MPRRTAADRLDQLVEAALEVFRVKGVKRAQMSDVAEAMGVSQGTLYNYVESKDALFYLLIDRAFGTNGVSTAELPVKTPRAGTMLKRLRERLDELARPPELERALATDDPPDARAELEGIVRGLYRMVATHWRGQAVLERSAMDMPELAELYFVDVRRRLIADLRRYLDRRMQARLLRPTPDPATTARVIIELVAWFAWHRREDPDSSSIDEYAAEEAVVDFVLGSLARDSGGP